MIATFLNKLSSPKGIIFQARLNPTVSANLCLAISYIQSNSRIKAKKAKLESVSSGVQSSQFDQVK